MSKEYDELVEKDTIDKPEIFKKNTFDRIRGDNSYVLLDN